LVIFWLIFWSYFCQLTLAFSTGWSRCAIHVSKHSHCTSSPHFSRLFTIILKLKAWKIKDFHLSLGFRILFLFDWPNPLPPCRLLFCVWTGCPSRLPLTRSRTSSPSRSPRQRLRTFTCCSTNFVNLSELV